MVTISLSWPQLLIELISVLLLFGFLRKYAYPPIMKAMRDRAAHIREELEAAEARRREAEELKAQLEQEVRDLKARVEQTLARAIGDAEERAQAIVEEAQREAKRILQDAEAEIRHEREAALASLRAQMVDLAIAVAEHVLRERLNEVEDRRLVNEFIDRIGVPQ